MIRNFAPALRCPALFSWSSLGRVTIGALLSWALAAAPLQAAEEKDSTEHSREPASVRPETAVGADSVLEELKQSLEELHSVTQRATPSPATGEVSKPSFWSMPK